MSYRDPSRQRGNSQWLLGWRVKAAIGGSATVYIGDYYERDQNGGVKTYYYLGGQRVAMRNAGVLTWLLSDHLGSTTVSADPSTGTRSSELRYKAYGETRYFYGATPTTYHFTGQREESTLGLYFYGARRYDAALGRFIQPDTIVPQPRSRCCFIIIKIISIKALTYSSVYAMIRPR